MIGKDALSRDLALYLPGLSTTLSFASLSVRAPFLELLETYLLKLDSRALRPALKAIILALLPGLEEETSEEFERTLTLMDAFKKVVRSSETEDLGQNHSSGDEYFWQCFFLASITSNSRRLGALAYLVRSLPKLGKSSPKELSVSKADSGKSGLPSDRLAEIVTSPEPGLLLRCFAAGLADEQLLIQRGFLDLLVTHLPLHADVLQKRVKPEDLELLVAAAAGVVARRDMSLNRRLWAWLLGPEVPGHEVDGGLESPASVSGDTSGAQSPLRTQYFEDFGLQPLTRALLKMIEKDATNPVERARPFRICLSLMDRWEIGGHIVPDIFMPIVISIRNYKDKTASKADFSEVLRSASVFFDGVESGLIWGEIVRLIAQAVGPGKASAADRTDRLSLVSFIIANFNVREEEMLLVHAPLTALTVLTLLGDERDKAEKQPADTPIPKEVIKLAFKIASDLIELIPERAFQTRPSTSQSSTANDNGSAVDLPNHTILQNIRTFYVQDQGNLDAFSPPFLSLDISELLLRESGSIVCRILSDPVSSADAGTKTRLLVMMLAKLPKVTALDVERLLSSIHKSLNHSPQLPFSTFTSIVSLATCLYSASYIDSAALSKLVDPLVRWAWSYLNASSPKYHVETVRSLWQLQTTLSFSNREIEASICSLMIENDVNGTIAIRGADAGRTLSVLWNHTLQDSSHADRRGSKAALSELKGQARLLGVSNYQVMLTRPVLLLLDAFLDERTQLFMTARTWLQSGIGMDKYVSFLA